MRKFKLQTQVSVGQQPRYQRLRLAGAHPFACGITALHYEPKRA